jgi:2-dehydropantoate 2-reductase
LRPRFDVVFLTAKSYDTHWLVEFIRPYLKEDGVLVSIQNSLNEEWIAPVLGAERVVGCVLTGGGELLEPGGRGATARSTTPYYTLGELSGENHAEIARTGRAAIGCREDDDHDEPARGQVDQADPQ